MSETPKEKPTPPPGFRFDAFADVRMGKSLFQMEPEDWLVKDKRAKPQESKP